MLLSACTVFLFSATGARGQDTEPRRLLAADLDDSDDDGVVDAVQKHRVPEGPCHVLEVKPGDSIFWSGPVRLVVGDRPVESPFRASSVGSVCVQGTAGSRRPGDAVVNHARGAHTHRMRLTVVAIRFLSGANVALNPTEAALGVSRRPTDDALLARGNRFTAADPDGLNVRVEIHSPVPLQRVWLNSWNGERLHMLEQRSLPLVSKGSVHRSPWVRLVGDETDREAPGVTGQVLTVVMRGRVEAHLHPPGQGSTTAVHQAPPRTSAHGPVGLRVGRPGHESGPWAARRVQLRVFVLRDPRTGHSVLHPDDRVAVKLARGQVQIANRIWMQCHIGFGDPQATPVRIIEPPPPTMLVVGGDLGLPAQTGGRFRFRVNGKRVSGPHVQGELPAVTAWRIARAVRRRGFKAVIYENPRVDYGAGPTMDVWITTRSGKAVELAQDGEHPLSEDRGQGLHIARVQMEDGIAEFSNANAAAGTPEERLLLRTISDHDPETIEILVINHFTEGTRQGEAFIPSQGYGLSNMVILDRNGIRQQTQSWAQSHEIGHVLLDHPFHPDNVGPDVPWMLMDADSSSGTVHGPKRISRTQCARVRFMWPENMYPQLLKPYLDAQIP